MFYSDFYKEYEKNIKQVDICLDKKGISIYSVKNKHYDFCKTYIGVAFEYNNVCYYEKVFVDDLKKGFIEKNLITKDTIKDSTFIGELDIKDSMLRVLKHNGIHTVEQVKKLSFSDLLRMSAISDKKAIEIVDIFKRYGIEIK